MVSGRMINRMISIQYDGIVIGVALNILHSKGNLWIKDFKKTLMDYSRPNDDDEILDSYTEDDLKNLIMDSIPNILLNSQSTKIYLVGFNKGKRGQ